MSEDTAQFSNLVPEMLTGMGANICSTELGRSVTPAGCKLQPLSGRACCIISKCGYPARTLILTHYCGNTSSSIRMYCDRL